MTAIAGAGDGRSLVLRIEYGLYHLTVEGTNRSKQVTGADVEDVIAKYDPSAPEEKVRAAAEILEGLLGIGG